jgi:hypothetical protein
MDMPHSKQCALMKKKKNILEGLDSGSIIGSASANHNIKHHTYNLRIHNWFIETLAYNP